jgi:SSS family solute:Na+ symporter
VLGLGLWAGQRAASDMDGFFLAGRTLGRWVVALSAVVSGRSAWLLLGFTGLAYSRGLSAVWAAVGYIAVEAVLFWFYAPRLRRFSAARDVLTLPDFFGARFGDPRWLRVLTSVVILVFMIAYVAAQLVAGGKALSGSFEVSQTTGVWLTAAIVLGYTVAGGFLAVSLTDVVQAVLMLGALVLLPLVAVVDFGGPGAVLAALSAQDAALTDPLSLGLGALVGFLGIGLGSPGNPHILTRYMSVDRAEALRDAAVIGTVTNVLMALGALWIGLVGRAAWTEPTLLPGGDVEQLFGHLANTQLHPALLGLVVAAVFSAIMSTADSQLLVAASTVVRDLYQRAWRQGEALSEAALVRGSRATIVVLVGLSLLLGFAAEDLVFWLVLFAWGGLGAALGPTSILALYWRRTTAAGVGAGLLTGAGTVVVWKSLPQLSGLIYELIPGFVAATLATVVVSLSTAPPDDADDSLAIMTTDG